MVGVLHCIVQCYTEHNCEEDLFRVLHFEYLIQTIFIIYFFQFLFQRFINLKHPLIRGGEAYHFDLKFRPCQINQREKKQSRLQLYLSIYIHILERHSNKIERVSSLFQTCNSSNTLIQFFSKISLLFFSRNL